MLSVRNLCQSYKNGSEEYQTLKNISFEIKKGEFVAVMGPSGSGKSTLLNCISSFIPYDSGEIDLNGTKLADLGEKEIAEIRNQKLGFIFQDFMLLDGLTVFENVCVPNSLSLRMSQLAIWTAGPVRQLLKLLWKLRSNWGLRYSW